MHYACSTFYCTVRIGSRTVESARVSLVTECGAALARLHAPQAPASLAILHCSGVGPFHLNADGRHMGMCYDPQRNTIWRKREQACKYSRASIHARTPTYTPTEHKSNTSEGCAASYTLGPEHPCRHSLRAIRGRPTRCLPWRGSHDECGSPTTLRGTFGYTTVHARILTVQDYASHRTLSVASMLTH